MNILSGLRGMFGAKPKASTTYDLTSMSPDQLREFIRVGGSMATASGASITEASAMRVAAAWRCVQIISGAVSTLPLDLIRRVSEDVREPAKGHPLRAVLTVKPNGWQTPSEFRKMMQAHLLLRGNAYALIVRAAGRVLALIPIHPDRVMVEQRRDMSISYAVTLPGGEYRTIEQRDIFHLRGMSLDGVKGLSVLSHMREALGLSLQAEQAGARLFRDGNLSGGVLSHPGNLGDDAYKRLKQSMDDRHGNGVENANKWMILEEGMRAERLALSATDAQFLETREFERYDIAMFFGVPPHMIGATEKSTSWGSGIEQQNIGFVTYTLNDWLKVWEEAIKRDLIAPAEAETLDARFFVSGLLRGDVKTRWEAYTKALQWGVFSPDDVRRLEDENPRPDGQGGTYYDPPNTAGKSQGEQADEPSEPAAG